MLQHGLIGGSVHTRNIFPVKPLYLSDVTVAVEMVFSNIQEHFISK